MIVQLPPPPLKVEPAAGQLVVDVKSAAFVPVIATTGGVRLVPDPIVNVPLWLFVRVNIIGVLGVVFVTAPKLKLLGAMLAGAMVGTTLVLPWYMPT